jgi:hypothetical protein
MAVSSLALRMMAVAGLIALASGAFTADLIARSSGGVGPWRLFDGAAFVAVVAAVAFVLSALIFIVALAGEAYSRSTK